MENINGIKLNKFPKELHQIGDLFYLYYALRTLYRTDNGELYVCTWVERDDTYSRWLLFNVSRACVLDYLNNKISSLQLIKNTTEPLICFDIDVNEDYHNITACSVDDLPTSYLPKPSALFNEDSAPDIKAIRAYLLENAPKTRPILEATY